MSHIINYVKLLTLLVFISHQSFGQENNYDLGSKAFDDKQYQDAISYLTKAVTLDKYEISGKELSMAYTYLAIIRTAHLEKSFGSFQVSEILNNHGNIKLAIDEMSNALHFQNSSSKSLMNKTAEKLAEISIKAAISIVDTLATLNTVNSEEQINELAHFIIYEFERLEQISGENWKLEDALGIAHYYINEKDVAMRKFNMARELFSTLEKKEASSLHVFNYMMSCEYLFNEQKDINTLNQILDEGITYIELMLSQYDEGELDGIKELTKKENRLQLLKSKLKK